MSINTPSKRASSTCTSENYSPDFFSELTDLAVPDFHTLSSPLFGLRDGQLSTLSSIQHQLGIIQAFTVSDDKFIEMQASTLYGFAEALLRQVAIVSLSVDEFHRISTVREANLKEKLSTSLAKIEQEEDEKEALMRLIDRLKKENRELKEGNHVAG